MVQDKILRVILKREFLFGTEIKDIIRIGDSECESIRKRLKQMRKYHEIGFILITFANKDQVARKIPYVQKRFDAGYKIRRPTYLYFPVDTKIVIK